ncbi:MAG TPA: MFS transporter [Stellaceae bacterium]|jgi:MFS transporter, ACS family, 4-hydroxyphenylacetate permease|nr:MFS transporter [Stellaceae bacterium]
MAMAQASTALHDKEQAVLKRVSNRYLWFLMICLMINFVDRTNIGFAALTMNKDLGLTATTFGLAGTALSVAYLIFEIPSNLILERVGARKWLARIMVTWGIASAATMFAVGPWSLAGFRALVGVAEAGFSPGLVLYMTYWYPQYRRASAQTMFMLGQPLAAMFSSTLGGFILSFNGAWGFAGWQWLFFLEGLPAIVFGIWIYYHLDDKPKTARFLSEDEKSTLVNLLERDEEARRRSQPTGPKRSVTRLVLGRNMLLLSFAYACLITTVSAQGLWQPQIVRGFAGAGVPTWQIGLIAAIPPACSIAWMVFWTRRSDRRSERFWHCIIPMLIAAAGWTLSGLSTSPVMQLLGLIIASAFSLSAWPVFFTTPSIILPREAHAPGLAFLNTVAIAGSSLSPIIVGRLRDITGGFSVPLLVVAGILILGVITMLFVPRDLLSQRTAEPAPAVA